VVSSLAHGGAVTCIDTLGDVLITASFDKYIRCYDIKVRLIVVKHKSHTYIDHIYMSLLLLRVRVQCHPR